MSQLPSPTYSERRPPRPIGLVLVDDHPAVLRGLADLLDGEPGIEVLGTADSGEQALDLAARLRPDGAIVDFHLGGENGLDLVMRLDELPHPPFAIVYSAFPGASLVAASAVAGARGMIAKQSLTHELPDAVRATRDGRMTMPHLSKAETNALTARLHPDDRMLLRMLMSGRGGEQTMDALQIDAETLRMRRRRAVHALTDRSHAALTSMQGGALHYSPSRGSG